MQYVVKQSQFLPKTLNLWVKNLQPIVPYNRLAVIHDSAYFHSGKCMQPKPGLIKLVV